MKELSCGAVTPLRALDIAIWMIGSDSKSAKWVRQEVGAPDWNLGDERGVSNIPRERVTRVL